jgi:hypothetical protein
MPSPAKEQQLLSSNTPPKASSREQRQQNSKDRIGNQNLMRIHNKDLEGVVTDIAPLPLKKEILPLLDGEEHLDGIHT